MNNLLRQSDQRENFLNTLKLFISQAYQHTEVKIETADTDPLKAELCSKFFASVYIELCTFSEPPEPDSNTVLDTISFSGLEIREKCQSLNTNKSKRPDDLPSVLFIKTQASLSHSIYQIFSKIIQTRRFPDYLKAAIISSIHKKDDKSYIENYRPVSLLCIVSKILEHVKFRRLYDHLSPMFHSSQHGFRKNKLTVLQLLTFLQTTYKSQDKASDMRPF